jgi:hypothetical protein
MFAAARRRLDGGTSTSVTDAIGLGLLALVAGVQLVQRRHGAEGTARA